MKALRCASVMVALVGTVGFAEAAASCEEYQALSDADTREFSSKLLDPSADSLDRLFAFQKLVCSSNPVIRAYAVREGFNTVKDPLVREQILFDAMFDKSSIVIEFYKTDAFSKKDKEYISKNSGFISSTVKYRSSTEWCLSLNNGDRCDPNYSVKISGSKVEMKYNAFVADFRLTESNELVGFVLPEAGRGYGKIPAIIKLF